MDSVIRPGVVLLTSISCLVILLFNTALYALQHHDMHAQAQLLAMQASQHTAEQHSELRWLNEGAMLTWQAEAKGQSYTAVRHNGDTLYIDDSLLIKPSVWFYAVVNTLLLIVMSLLGWYWRQRRQQTVTRLNQLTDAIVQLATKVELPVDNEMTAIDTLRQINDRLGQLLKREQEVRHLVRVQGLVDHELAIGNRVFFESKLQHYLSDTAEVGHGALFIIQLTAGDTLRSAVKPLARLKGCIDILHALAADFNNTVLARLSEYDLVLLVEGLAAKDIVKLGDKMASILSRASCFADCADQDVLHIGYAGYQRGQTSYQVLSEADMALKTAQLHGPNAAFGFEPQDKLQAKGSVWWRSELNRALQEQRFSLSFQPVFSWQDRDILQHEVLVRLQSTDGGSVAAGIFLPMAYNCGLSVQIDQHVLLKTSRLCAVDSHTFNRCSVNISTHALLDPTWWQWLEQMLVSGQIDPQQLALEISEHHLLRQYRQLKSRLLKLHKAGFSLIIDHVGLVIDNAVYIEELPLESVKLHPSVVRNIDQHLEQQLFVRGLIASYSSKGIRVIATGVELEAEWMSLQKLGVAGGQGFYFSQPLNQIIAQGQLQ